MELTQNGDKIYTIIVDRQGTTEVLQYRCNGLAAAVREWRSHYGLERVDDEYINDVVPIRGMMGVWCVSDVDESDVLVLAHVIRTFVE